MPTTILSNVNVSAEEFRKQIYDGGLISMPPRPALQALGAHARQMIQEAFGSLDPRLAQFHMPVEDYVRTVADLKPRFIHHATTKHLLRQVLEEFGFDSEKTYFDVPRLRMVTSDGYLTTGVGYAHHPHRDTWYSAPMQQVNWWLPLFEICPSNTIAFHPWYWDHAVKNSSGRFNYYHWNGLRSNVAQHVGSDTRFQPMAEEPYEFLEPAVRIVTPRDGVIAFSGAQLHSTVPNTSGVTRYSIDFRTVDFDDVVKGIGAPNLDSAPQGTSLRDFMHIRTLERMPEEVVQKFDSGERDGVLVYVPDLAASQKA